MRLMVKRIHLSGLFCESSKQAGGSAINPEGKVLPRLTVIDALYEQLGLVDIAAELNLQFHFSGPLTLHDPVVPFSDPP
jgi:hypothetical protein